MPNLPIKQMLYMTIRRKADYGHVIFEMEPYYKRSRRYTRRSYEIDVFEKQLLLRDDELKEKIGFGLVLSLFIYGENEHDPENRVWSQIAYPHFEGAQTVIRLDMEPYRYKSSRVYCGELLLPSLNMDIVVRDESFKRTLSEHMLRYLPITAELCMMRDDNAEE